jgi:hypothetical protein
MTFNGRRKGNADLFLNDIYSALSNKWNSPDNLDNFTDDNDAGFYWKSYSWRQGIVDPAVNLGTPMDHANGNATDYASWGAGFLKIRKCNLFIQKITENSANFSEAYIKKRIDEARFLRAYYYSEMFLHLGGLPIMTEVLDRNTMSEAELYQPGPLLRKHSILLPKSWTKLYRVMHCRPNTMAAMRTLAGRRSVLHWL